MPWGMLSAESECYFRFSHQKPRKVPLRVEPKSYFGKGIQFDEWGRTRGTNMTLFAWVESAWTNYDEGMERA